MSFVTTQPEMRAAAAGNLQALGSAMAAHNAAAAAPTTGVMPGVVAPNTTSATFSRDATSAHLVAQRAAW